MIEDTQLRHSFFEPHSRSWVDTIERTEHNLLFLNYDFASTRLGPLEDWCFALRMHASMVFSDSRAACVYWGPDRTAFYNEKFGVLCGGIHPTLMGTGFKNAMPELEAQIEPIFQQVTTSGQSVEVNNLLLFPNRHGFPEEMIFIGQFMPIRGFTGEIEGVYNSCYDCTSRAHYERRRRVVDLIAAILPSSVDETLALFMQALHENPKDITMALLYTYDELSEHEDRNLRLHGAIGVEPDHACAPSTAKLESDQRGLIPLFRKVKFIGQMLVLNHSDGSLQAAGNIFDDVSWSGYGEPARTVTISCLSANQTVFGFLVIGTCPRRDYDESTERSILDMVRQMETKWVTSLSSEQARQREQLLERRAADSEQRLRHMARHAPLGMCQVSPNETIEWANDQYYEITGHDRHRPHLNAFREQIADDEISAASGAFQAMLHGTPRLEREIRLKRKYTPPAGELGDPEGHHAWILAVSFPMMEDGKLKLVMGYISDISHLKWAENVQARNAAAAVLAKHRQEEFIDTTSHEMRNPLSAITQLADGISRSLDENQEDTIVALRKIAEDNADAARTILACTAHQRRVVDDVLMLSGLDSHILSITPVPEQPLKVVQDTVRMFMGEARLGDIEIESVKDECYDYVNVNTALIDTSRLMQILINLMSNSMKFVANRPKRKISVVYGAHTINPPDIKTVFGEIHWTQPAESNLALPKLRDDEDIVYLYFYVRDSGTGLGYEETQRLFKRFSQGTSRTHVTYGGSGLGLYICKQLAEKQGGSIGVASIKGEGSVFAFYVETRIVSPLDRGNVVQPASSIEAGSLDAGPVRSKSEPLSTKTSTSLAQQRTKTNRTPSTQIQKAHVLLVEDNLINQKVLTKQLSDAGFVVSVANHGLEALEILDKSGYWRQNETEGTENDPHTEHRGPIKIVFMDLEMPIMNGLECCKELRRREALANEALHVPIIAITANVRQEQQDGAREAGVDHVLSKPFTISELIAKVDGLLHTEK